MNRILMSVVGMAGLLAAFSAPAMAQEENKDWIWHMEGKHSTRTWGDVKPYVPPTTMTIAISPGEEREGDSWHMKPVGKHMEREYTREVPLPDVVKGHECSWRFHMVGRHTVRENYCVENGVEQPCFGVNATGGCISRK